MHLRSLISPFVIDSLENITAKLATCNVSVIWLVSVAEQNGLSLSCQKTGFLVKGLILYLGLTRVKPVFWLNLKRFKLAASKKCETLII